jgi:hypothetical protein
MRFGKRNPFLSIRGLRDADRHVNGFCS